MEEPDVGTRMMPIKLFRILQHLLRSTPRTISVYRQIGSILNDVIGGPRAAYGTGWNVTARIAKQLDVPGLRSKLQHARRIAIHWTEADARAATKKGLSLKAAVLLLRLDTRAALLQKAGREAEAAALRAQRRRLAAAYPKTTAALAWAKWRGRIAAALDEAGLPVRERERARELTDARRYLLHRLDAMLERMRHMPARDGAQWKKLIGQVKRLKRGIERELPEPKRRTDSRAVRRVLRRP